MKVTVLGNNGPFPSIGGACSSYLFDSDHKHILSDCGNGSLSNLFTVIRPETLSCIIISHLHYDHFSDILVLKYYLNILKAKKILNDRIDIYVPDHEMNMLIKDDNIFNMVIINEETEIELKDMRVTFCETNHPVMCFASSYETDKKRIVYTADTVYTEKMVKFCGNADVLIADCGLLNGQEGYHLTAGECGMLAKESDSKKLVLSHLNPLNSEEMALFQASEHHMNVCLAEIFGGY